MRSPAGRAIPCIKLLPLPPPRGLHVSFPEGMVSCKPGRVLEPDICVLCEVRWLLVSGPKGRVSCRREHVLGLRLGLNDGCYRLQSASGQGCMGRRFFSQLQADATGLLVSFLEGMGSCRPGLVLVLCPSSYGGCSSLQCWHCCRRRRIPWRRRWRSVVDQADVCCVHGSGRPFCHSCVAGLVLRVLGGRAPVCLVLCP